MIGLLLAFAAQADGLGNSDVANLFRSAQSNYVSCVREQAIALDDSASGADTIAKAAVTACDEDRSRALMAMTAWYQIEKHIPAERVARLATETLNGTDVGLRDRVTVLILQHRRPAH